jgi:hypothetical protein
MEREEPDSGAAWGSRKGAERGTGGMVSGMGGIPNNIFREIIVLPAVKKSEILPYYCWVVLWDVKDLLKKCI